MKENKIVFVIPSLTAGGAERVVSILANEFVNFNDVEIIQLYKDTPFYSLNKNVRLKYCKKKYSPKTNILKSIANHIFMVYKIRKLIRDADVIIGFTTTCNIYTVLTSKLTGIPCIISERINPNCNISNKIWERLRKYLYPKANKIVVQTSLVKDYFMPFVNESKLEIISNPIDSELTKYRDLNAEKENIILHVGRLDKQKNQELLIKAFANIPHNGWRLVLIGEGYLKDKYESLINKLNEQNDIFLLGKTNTVYNEYNRARIFALTSDYEGFPNALIEAMHFGVPCISTDCPSGPSDLIINSENGFLIPVNDQNALETRLIELMEDESLQEKFSKNAIKSTAQFKAEKITKEWMVLINELIT